MKNLNVEKLSESGFTDRFLDFVKEYEKARNIKLYDTVVDWFIEKKYEYIKTFLSSKPKRYFSGMNTFINKIKCFFSYKYRRNFTRMNTLLNKKDNLYKEFMSFYE